MVNKINNNISKLSPDGSGRFIITGDILNKLYNSRNKVVKILDVGGGSSYISSMLMDLKSQYELTSLDLIPKPINYRGTYIQADATKMPLKDNEFEVVISTDVLEHIPDNKKCSFISECIRVSSEYIIIAAPFNTDGVDSAEHATNDFNKYLFKEGQSWLEEHFSNKKPELDSVLSFIKKLGYETKVVGSNNIYSWLLTTHANLLEAKLGLGIDKIYSNNRILNEDLLSSGDMLPPYYRQFIVIFKSKKKDSLELGYGDKKINHSIMTKYIHEIMTIIADRIENLKDDSIKNDRKYKKEISELRLQVEKLKDELSDKEAVIDSCKRYLKLRGFFTKQKDSK